MAVWNKDNARDLILAILVADRTMGLTSTGCTCIQTTVICTSVINLHVVKPDFVFQPLNFIYFTPSELTLFNRVQGFPVQLWTC